MTMEFLITQQEDKVVNILEQDCQKYLMFRKTDRGKRLIMSHITITEFLIAK